MSLINFNKPSLHSSNETIHNLLLKKLSIIHPTSHIVEIFKNKDFIHVVTQTNIHIHTLVERIPSVEDIISTITLLKDSIRVVSKELHYIKDHTTQKAVYSAEVHNVYGIFILEMNSLIRDTEIHLRDFKLSTRSLDNLFNDPNTKPELVQYNDKTNDSPPSCCWNRKKIIPKRK